MRDDVRREEDDVTVNANVMQIDNREPPEEVWEMAEVPEGAANVEGSGETEVWKRMETEVAAGDYNCERNGDHGGLEANVLYVDGEELLDEVAYHNTPHGEINQCPYIEVAIGTRDIKEMALIDTGSQVCCISQALYDSLREQGEKMEETRVSNVHLVTAVGGRSKRVTRQVLLRVRCGEVESDVPCLVIPNLVTRIVLGIEWCVEHQVNMKFTQQGGKYKIHITKERAGQLFVIASDGGGHKEVMDDRDEYVVATSMNVVSITGSVPRDDIEVMPRAVSLTEDEEERLNDLVTEFDDVFSDKPGLTHVYRHRLGIKDTSSFMGKAYPIPRVHRPAVQKVIDEMMENGIIRKANTRYINPLIVVPKKDGSVRICLDAREVNKRIEPAYERPEKVQDLIRRFHGNKWLTSLDLTSGYWQVELAKEDQPYTGFGFGGISYCFQRVPFGLKTAGSGFIRALNIALGNDVRDYAVVYVDDLIVFSRTFVEHLIHLKSILTKLREAGLTIKRKKSIFCQEEIRFLGHLVSGQGVRPDPERVKAIWEFPLPRTQRQLKSFLGICNFYRPFVKNYAMVMTDLRDLLKGGSKWKWNSKAEAAFTGLKEAFQREVILSQPDLSRRFSVECDASYIGVGAVLYQEEGEERRVITMASRGLNKAEQNYTVTEIELLSVVFALTKFREYVLGRKVTIVTDHKALEFLLTSKFSSNRLMRWMLYIQEYDFEIRYRKGKDNVVADFLSRHPVQDGRLVNQEHCQGVMIGVTKIHIDKEIRERLKHLKRIQQECPRGKEIMVVLNGENNDKRLAGNFQLMDEYICHLDRRGQGRIWIPEELEKDVTWAYHQDLGHYGSDKCYSAIRQAFWWKGMSRGIRKILATCDRCQRTKHPARYLEGPWQNVRREAKGDLVLCDYYGPLVKSKGKCQYIFVIIDSFTKFVKMYPLQRATTKATLDKFLDKYCVEYGKPKEILSDHGTQFTSKVWIETLAKAGIKAIFSSVRNPQGNQAERVMRRLGQAFRIYCQKEHWKWKDWMYDIERWMNITVHASTGYTPLQLQTGELPSYTVPELLGLPARDGDRDQKFELVMAQENMDRAAKKRGRQQKKIFYDELAVGSEVLLRTPGVSCLEKREMAKFLDLYEGPYVIKWKLGNNAYVLQGRDGTEKGVYNVRLLRKYVTEEGSRRCN